MSFNTGEVDTAMTTMHMLETAEADIVYDVHGPLPTADGRPPLFMIAQPMDASGFGALASHFPDRTVVTYDPRGLGRSIRKDGRVDHAPTVQADDVHAVIEALGAGPVEMFASSGGAVTALALVAAYPDDVVTLVAHEPPLIPVLPDAEAAARARAGVRDAYEAKGSSAGHGGLHRDDLVARRVHRRVLSTPDARRRTRSSSPRRPPARPCSSQA
jgi:pimeloyl-ACP methyl ester carboxylesterase